MTDQLARSSALFGNEKMAMVLHELDQLDGLSTAQQIASRAAIGHSLVSKVLRRLEAAGVLVSLPRQSSRGELFFQVVDRELFDVLAVVASRLVNDIGPPPVVSRAARATS